MFDVDTTATILLTLVAAYVLWVWLWRDYAADSLRADMLAISEDLMGVVDEFTPRSGATRRATVTIARRVDATYRCANSLGFWRVISVVAGARFMRLDISELSDSQNDLQSVVAAVRDPKAKEALERLAHSYRNAIVGFYLKTSLTLCALFVIALVGSVVSALASAGRDWVLASLALKDTDYPPAASGFLRMGITSAGKRLVGQAAWVDRDTQAFLAI